MVVVAIVVVVLVVAVVVVTFVQIIVWVFVFQVTLFDVYVNLRSNLLLGIIDYLCFVAVITFRHVLLWSVRVDDSKYMRERYH